MTGLLICDAWFMFTCSYVLECVLAHWLLGTISMASVFANYCDLGNGYCYLSGVMPQSCHLACLVLLLWHHPGEPSVGTLDNIFAYASCNDQVIRVTFLTSGVRIRT